ncbi:MAG: class I SAM-dependent methyltransferase [Dokdonella sp.]|nr:class I SAM-dependent methyltransferase [Dokdonella sp.]
MSESTKPMAFTGERFTPECVREIWYEHWHRYAFALPLVSGRRVLDAACGEGYGSALLARHAASVVGVDISPQAIEHARLRYGGASNLRFDTGDAAALEFQDASFDIVVSFETLEHLEAQQALVAGFARVLADDGLLLISSPDKAATATGVPGSATSSMCVSCIARNCWSCFPHTSRMCVCTRRSCCSSRSYGGLTARWHPPPWPPPRPMAPRSRPHSTMYRCTTSPPVRAGHYRSTFPGCRCSATAKNRSMPITMAKSART